MANPVGRQEKIVKWTSQAWQMIQRDRADWTFRRKQFSHDLVASDVTYDPVADFGLADFGGWVRDNQNFQPVSLYDPAIGRADEQTLQLVGYDAWLSTYDIGVPTPTRPRHVAAGYDDTLNFGPAPDRTYTVRGWYERGLQVLAADGDVPFINADFHQAIVWRALMLLADDGEASIAMQTCTNQYRIQYSAMLRRYTQAIEV